MSNFTRVMFTLLAVLLLLAAPRMGIAHENPTTRDEDEARNHLVSGSMPAVYFIRITGSVTDTATQEMKSEHVKFGIGTGFGVTKSGLVMTKMHVLNPFFAKIPGKLTAPNTLTYDSGVTIKLTVDLYTKDGTRYTALVVAGDPNDDVDLALLQIMGKPRNDFPYLVLAEELPLYDSVITIGNPYGILFTVAEGIISNPHAVFAGKHLLQTTALMVPGSSGGPIIRTRDHKVVGIVESTFEFYNGVPVNLGFGTPSTILAKFLRNAIRRLGI